MKTRGHASKSMKKQMFERTVMLIATMLNAHPLLCIDIYYAKKCLLEEWKPLYALKQRVKKSRNAS